MAWLPVKNLVLGEFPFWFRPWGRSLVRLGRFWGAEEARKRREARTRKEICIFSQPSDKVGVSLEDQFGSGRVIAAISSRPGQCG